MSAQVLTAFTFGTVFVISLIVLAIKFPKPTPFQYNVFRIVLALAAAGVAAMIPGFIDLQLSPSAQLLIRAGGAIAVFVIIFFFNPAQLVAHDTSAAVPDAQIASISGVLKHRATEIQSELEMVIEILTTLHKDDTVDQLKEFSLRFEALHGKHLTAITTGDLHLSHEIVGQIHELIFNIRSLVSSTVGVIGREWHASLGRSYFNTPRQEEDPEYAAIQSDFLKLREETVARTDAMDYPGEVLSGATKTTTDLVLGISE
jgi:hypothetical protein